MSCNVLKGNRGVIFKHSIAWETARKTREESGNFILANTIITLFTGKINELARVCDAGVISTDATSGQDLITLFTKSVGILTGKPGFMLHSTGI